MAPYAAWAVTSRLLLTLFLCGLPPAATALDLKGRSVTIYVGGGPGGGVDIFARTLAPYLGRHLPGEPAVVISNMPGNGGMQAVQYAFNIAARDGTAAGTTNAGPVVEPLMGSGLKRSLPSAKAAPSDGGSSDARSGG